MSSALTRSISKFSVKVVKFAISNSIYLGFSGPPTFHTKTLHHRCHPAQNNNAHQLVFQVEIFLRVNGICWSAFLPWTGGDQLATFMHIFVSKVSYRAVGQLSFSTD